MVNQRNDSEALHIAKACFGNMLQVPVDIQATLAVLVAIAAMTTATASPLASLLSAAAVWFCPVVSAR